MRRRIHVPQQRVIAVTRPRLWRPAVGWHIRALGRAEVLHLGAGEAAWALNLGRRMGPAWKTWKEYVDSHEIIRTREAKAAGVSPALIAQALRREDIFQIAPGLYIRRDVPDDRPLRLRLAAEHYGGKLCLTTALEVHGIQFTATEDIWVALETGRWIPKEPMPNVRFVQMARSNWLTETENHPIDTAWIPVFTLTKSVIDCFKFREHVGLETAVLALDAFMSRRVIPEERLFCVARDSRVEKIVRGYVAAWKRREIDPVVDDEDPPFEIPLESVRAGRRGRPPNRHDPLPEFLEQARLRKMLPRHLVKQLSRKKRRLYES